MATAVPAPATPPPDGGYGWICVAACFSTNCFTWGVVASYGVYLADYLAYNRFPDANVIDFAFIGGFNFAMAMLVAPLVTVVARHLGTQTPMVFGVVLQTAGFIAASFSHTIWQLWLSQGVLVGFGVGFIYVPSVAILSQWFDKRRSLVNGISAAGSGIGGIVFSFGTQAMINNISYPWSLRITGIITGFANLLAALLIRNRNTSIKPSQRGFDLRLLARYDVLLLLGWAFVSMLGYITILFSLSDFAYSIRLSSTQAAAITGFLNLGTALGRPFIGIVSDRYGRIEIAGLLTFICGIIVFAIWLPSTSFAVTVLFSVVNGAILGVFWVTIGPLCVEVAGLVELPSLLSLSWISIILPTCFSQAIALELRRPQSGREYLYPQIFAGTAYILGSLIMLELWRVNRNRD